MLTIQNLRKSFGDIVAVDGISFTIEKGETFGLLGPNGAGKTTTLNVILGVLKADEGTVRLKGGEDPAEMRVRRRLGNAPQALALYEELTGEENLAFFGKLYGLKGARLKERVEWALDFVGLANRRKDRLKTYSGGMQRRLNLACAVVHEPDILLLDEPTVGVDPQSRAVIFEKIEALKNDGCTLIYTTHYMEEAQRLCDRVAIIDHGKILALDTVSNLISRHGGGSLVEMEVEVLPSDASAFPGEWNGNVLQVRTDEPYEIIAQLIQKGLKPTNLKVIRADLESVFLNLTGRRLRD